MTLVVRPYQSSDYQKIIALYKQGDLYGGQFDENRDSEDRLAAVVSNDPQAILVCENKNEVLGTVSLIEDGRVAWLFRFAVKKNEFEKKATEVLYSHATQILKERGHNEVLVYSPSDDNRLSSRYIDLGMNKGGSYNCFWAGMK